MDSDATTLPPDQNGNKPTFLAGSTNLNLRGYGSDATIILVNARRLPEILLNNRVLGVQAQQPDVNFIPLSLVERVEVLPVSASALYTGDPVGGVINIVLRPEVNATEVTATYTNALRGFDAPQSTLSLQHGETLLGGALRVRLNASFTEVMPPTESELSYIQANLQAHPASTDSLHRATPNVTSANQSPLFGPGTASSTSVAPGADGSGGLVAFAGRQGVRDLTLFDSPGGMAASPDSVDFPYGHKQRGASYFASVTYDMFPWLQVGVDGIYTRTVANRGYDVFTDDLVLNAASPFNPFKQDVNVSLNEIAPQLGKNYSEAHLDFSSAVLGFLFKGPGDWRASLDAQYGRSITKYRGLAGVDTTHCDRYGPQNHQPGIGSSHRKQRSERRSGLSPQSFSLLHRRTALWRWLAGQRTG